MNLRTLLLAACALGSAGVTGLLVNNWLDRQRAQMQVRPVVPPAPEAMVLVSRRTVGAGTLLKPEHLEWRAWPRDGLIEAYAVKGQATPEGFTGAVVRRGLAAGEPITAERVVKPGERGFLAAVLTPGARALSVPVSPAAGVSGLVLPGDRVDLIVTHQITERAIDGSERTLRRASETLLTDIRVLAIGQKTDEENGKPIVANTATVEVTPKQAEIVSLAIEMGKLSLSLRSLALDDEADATTVRNAGFSYTRDTDISRLIRPSQKAADQVVQVLRGGASGSRR
jgi:pilus assembly protein CpaB